MDFKKIEQLILDGDYEKAAEEIFRIIENPNDFDKETIYTALTLLNQICDKLPSISLRSVKNITISINDSNSRYD